MVERVEVVPVWVVSRTHAVLTSPTGQQFPMSIDHAAAVEDINRFLGHLARRCPGSVARVAASYPDVVDALKMFMDAMVRRGEEAFGPLYSLYLAAVMHRVSWADLGMEVIRG